MLALLRSLLCFLALWPALALPAFAQAATWSNALRFQRFERNQELSNLAVRCIVQDKHGFLWIGTEDGLNRYDGRRIFSYRHNPDDPHSLPSNMVIGLCAARDGALWILPSSGELCRYDPTTDRFIRASLPKLESKRRRYTSALYEDAQGNLWIGGDGYLIRYRLKSEQAKLFPLPNVERPGLPPLTYQYVQSLTASPDGRVWLTFADRLWRFDQQTERFVQLLSDEDRQQYAVAYHPNGRLYISTGKVGSDDWGLTEYDAQDERVITFHRFNLPPGGSRYVSNLTADGDFLWAGVVGYGVVRFDVRSNACQLAPYAPTNLRSPVGDLPLVVYRDRSGVIWVGDGRFGLSKLTPYAAYFKTYRTDPERPNTLSDGYIRGMCEDKEGDWWVGTYGGLNHLSRTQRTIRAYQHRPGDAQSLAHDKVWAVLEDRAGQLWVGTDAGLQTFDRRTERFRPFPMPPNENSRPQAIRVIYEDRDGALLVGSESGLFTISPDRRSVKPTLEGVALPSPFDKEALAVEALERTPDGALWIGHRLGVLRLAPDGKELRGWQSALGRPTSGVPTVCAFLTDSRGRFWLATKGMGLLRYDAAQDRFYALTERQGLPHDNVYAVLEDKRGRLWISTDNGLARYEPDTGKIRHYRAEEGLQGREFNRRAYLKTRAGIMVFGGTQGLTAFPPDELEDNPHPPPVAALVKATGKTFLATPDNAAVTLNYEDGGVTLLLAALDFNAPDANQFAYRIVGRDRDWRPLGTRDEITLADLSPGSWIIAVKAANNDGLWNENGLQLKLFIRPPWWRSWWAYAVYALLAVGALGGLYQARLYRARLLTKTRVAQAKLAAKNRAVRKRAKVSRLLAAKNLELAEANDRLRELDAVKQRFTAMLVHDLKAPLASVRMLLDLLETLIVDKIDAEIREIMHNTALSADRTLQLINEMLEVMRAETTTLQLNIQPVSPKVFLEAALATARPLAAAKGQTLTGLIPDDLPTMSADAGKLERAVTNLLSNAVKFTPEGGEITLEVSVVAGKGVERGRELLLIQVIDTGPGIPEKDVPYIFDPYRQATAQRAVGVGLGLAIVRNIVAAHGGNVNVRSQVGVGTNFIITLPTGRRIERMTVGGDESASGQPGRRRCSVASVLPPNASSV
ncbi:MAG: ATP-binding protein [Chloracidobacterium sp.]|nr:ATP-binding protein [Chloracidobacterium sp.]MDW8218310.1 two-component regulator propeller domain-containing protein [Acidobacteriota bacterium]